MYKRTLTYKDYNDVERTEDFFFHISQAEIMELQNSVVGGLEAILKRIQSTTEFVGIVAEMKRLLLLSVGIKTPDGRFEKSAEIVKHFESSAAYPILFMELATDVEAGAAFVNGVIPAGAIEETAARTQANNERLLARAQENAQVQNLPTMPPPPPNDIGTQFKAPVV